MNIKNQFNYYKHWLGLHNHRLAAVSDALILLLVFIVLGSSHSLAIKPVEPPVQPEGAYSPNVLLVKIKSNYRARLHENAAGTGVASLDQVLARHHTKTFKKIARPGKKSKTSAEIFGWYKISLDPNRSISSKLVDGKTTYPELDQMQSELTKDPSVQLVTKDYQIHSSVVPNDPYYTSSGSWGQTFEDLYGLKKINAATAWDTTTGSSAITAAVIDTGVDKTHPDISSNIWSNPGETGTTQAGDRCWTGAPADKSTNNCDDDNNGFIDDVNGWNFVGNNNNTLDDNGHGTHVAGTIAAVGNNSTGVVGVSWTTKIMPVKVLDSTGSGTMSEAALGLQYAADMGAKVTNNSYSCGCNSSVVDDAVKYEHDRNVTTVVAAGNNGGANSLDYSPSNSDGAIVVGATDNNDTIASFSNTGAKVDVMAPGVDILSLKSSLASTTCIGSSIVNTNYCHISGTSMATPHVVGLASLMLAVNPSLTPEQIRQILHTTGQDLGSVGHDNTFGFGRIKADTAVAAAASPTVLTPYITSPLSRSTITGTSVAVTGTADGATFKSYKLEVGAGRTPSSWVTLATSTTPVTSGTLATIDSTTLPDGAYTLRLTVTDTSNNTFEYSTFDVQTDNFDDALATPMNIMAIGTVEIDGVANAKNGLVFDHYTVEWGAGTSPGSYSTTGVTLTNGGTTAITTGGPLATVNTSGFTDQQPYTIRLTVYSTNGDSVSTTATAYADSKLVNGWPKYLSHNNGCNQSLGGCDTPGVLFADIDGDGQKEVIIPSNSNKIYAFHKDGTAVAGWPVTVTSGDYFQSEPVAVDLDGDLLPEIAIVANIGNTAQSRLYIIRHDGTLYPGWPKPVLDWDAGEDPDISTADLDGDGKLELVMIARLWNTITTTQLFAYHLDGTELAGFPKTIPTTGPYWLTAKPPTIADLDGDGHPDIVYAEYNNVSVYNYQGNLEASWTLPDTNGYVNATQGPPAIGDVNGDGIKEIIINAQKAGTAGNVPSIIYAYEANGTLLSGWPYSIGGTSMSYWYLNTIATADVDNDGKDEVIVGQWGSGVIDDGTGPKTTSTFNARPALSLADFDGDGNLKLPGDDNLNPTFNWANTSNLGIYYSNNHFATFTSEFPTAATNPVGDLDKNGHQEFAIPMLHNSDNYTYLMEMPGTTHPLDSWPMFGHDPQQTGHYTIGQETVDNIAPQVAITSPSNNSAQSGTVNITTNAIDETAISKVEYYVDGSLIATDTTFPYSGSWNSTGATGGSHTVMAKAYDTSNNTTTSSVSITTPDITPPSQPTNIVASSRTDFSITVGWSASTDDVGVTGYKIFRNGTQIGTSATTSYIDGGLSPNTAYTYAISAYDAAGNNSSQGSNSLSTLPDSTAPSQPTNIHANSTTDKTINLAWNASTDNVGVVGYKVYRNGVQISSVSNPSYSDSGLVPNTAYTYAVSAYDALNNTSVQSTVNLSTLPDTTVPTVSLTSPANNSNVSRTITLTASANDDVGVSSVSFYLDNNLIGTANLAPYDLTWNSDTTTVGAHILKVTVFDAAGNSSSSQVSVTVHKVGDINNDGSVNIQDLSILLSHYSQNYAVADFNSDGTVNIVDLSILLSNYGL